MHRRLYWLLGVEIELLRRKKRFFLSFVWPNFSWATDCLGTVVCRSCSSSCELHEIILQWNLFSVIVDYLVKSTIAIHNSISMNLSVPPICLQNHVRLVLLFVYVWHKYMLVNISMSPRHYYHWRTNNSFACYLSYSFRSCVPFVSLTTFWRLD